jgi:hypothetical protein
VPRAGDAAERSYVDVMACADAPDHGPTSCPALDLQETTDLFEGKDVRVELAGTCRSSQPVFLDVLATTALAVTNDAWLAALGVVLREAVGRYDRTATVPHLLLPDPFPSAEHRSVDVCSAAWTCTAYWRCRSARQNSILRLRTACRAVSTGGAGRCAVLRPPPAVPPVDEKQPS